MKDEATAQNIRAALQEMGFRCGEISPNKGGTNFQGGEWREKSAGGFLIPVATTAAFPGPFTLVTVESSEGFSAKA